jgi:hypothetical protein
VKPIYIFRNPFSLFILCIALEHSAWCGITDGENPKSVIKNGGAYKAVLNYTREVFPISKNEKEIVSRTDAFTAAIIKDVFKDDINDKASQVEKIRNDLYNGFKNGSRTTDNYEIIVSLNGVKIKPLKATLEKNTPTTILNKSKNFWADYYFLDKSTVNIRNVKNISYFELNLPIVEWVYPMLRDVYLSSDMQKLLFFGADSAGRECKFFEENQMNGKTNKIIIKASNITQEYLFLDWRSVDGVMLPMKIVNRCYNASMDHLNSEEICEVESATTLKILQDDYFDFSDLPFTRVRDERFNPILAYYTKGALLDDTQLTEFAASPRQLELHNAMMIRMR